jgi:phosphoribosylamine---glycine ligase
MNILIIGSGGREHAFAWKIAQSKHCGQLYIAPGNAGTANHGQNLDLDTSDFELIKDTVEKHRIQLVVVGPEIPLAAGIVDYLNENTNVPVIGPGKHGAMLESSKSFAKAFMLKYDIPTASYKLFDSSSFDEGMAFIKSGKPPYVLKADGLAAGKGVLICPDTNSAVQEFMEMLQGKFGPAGNKVVVESFLTGIELSVFVFTDGEHYKILPTAKDYKRIGENDTGLNTGGMGAVSPVPFADDTLMEKIERKIIKPTIAGLQHDNIPYKGIIYLGLIKVGEEPFVIEYNVRFGDPEAEVVIPKIKSDLVEIFMAMAENRLHELTLEFDPRAAATVMLVSGGYPGNYEKGKKITGIEKVKDSIVFHAGTKKSGDEIQTNGGRVISITSFGDTLTEALEKSKQSAEIIDFEGKFYRKDIGFEVV